MGSEVFQTGSKILDLSLTSLAPLIGTWTGETLAAWDPLQVAIIALLRSGKSGIFSACPEMDSAILASPSYGT